MIFITLSEIIGLFVFALMLFVFVGVFVFYGLRIAWIYVKDIVTRMWRGELV